MRLFLLCMYLVLYLLFLCERSHLIVSSNVTDMEPKDVVSSYTRHSNIN